MKPEITEVQRLTLKPGDRLIVKVDSSYVTEAEAVILKQKIRAALNIGETIPVVIFTPEIDAVVVDGFPDSGTAELAD